jgi:lipopolysaccharide export LptBFGC system permease protein LptF
MSSGGFHVHGPHDHELEHARSGHADHDVHGDEAAKRMTNQIALFTAVIATVGALFAYMGGATQANAGIYKNNAAIKKTEASNQWNYFQAKSTKQSLAEISRDLTTSAADREKYQAKIDRYEKEKSEIKAVAEGFEQTSRDWDKKSDEQIHLHHRWAQATTVLQVSIALAAIALLTRRKWLEWGMFGTGALGVAIGVAAMLHI